MELLSSNSKIIPIDGSFAHDAGKLHAEIKEKTKNFSYGDAFALLTAKKFNASLVTGDPDFKGMKNIIFLHKS